MITAAKNLTVAEVENICDSGNGEKIEHLDFSAQKERNERIAVIFGSLKNTSFSALTSLNVASAKLRPADMLPLSKALEVNKSIKILSLQKNQIGDAGAFFLAAALKVNNTLFELNLTNCSITKGGIIGTDLNMGLTKGLMHNKGLSKLILSSNLIGDDGNVALVGAMKFNKTLHQLELATTQMTQKGAVKWAEFIDSVEKNKDSLRTYFSLDILKNTITNNNDDDTIQSMVEEMYKTINEKQTPRITALHLPGIGMGATTNQAVQIGVDFYSSLSYRPGSDSNTIHKKRLVYITEANRTDWINSAPGSYKVENLILEQWSLLSKVMENTQKFPLLKYLTVINS